MSRGKSEGQLGIVAHGEGLIELVVKRIKQGGVGSSRNGDVNNGEGDRTIVVNKDFEADREARVSFTHNGDRQGVPTDADKITFGLGGKHVSEGVESPCSSGKGRRALR